MSAAAGSSVPGPGHSLGTILAIPLVWAIRAYQMVISPMLAQQCRFHPTCSAYAVTALQRHGVVRGLWLAVRRLARCHPWNPGGVDHVPESGQRTNRGRVTRAHAYRGPRRAQLPRERALPDEASHGATRGQEHGHEDAVAAAPSMRLGRPRAHELSAAHEGSAPPPP